MKTHKFGLDHRGEFDEVFVKNASVHIERMGETAFWMRIDAPGLPSLMLNTGVHRGTWYFWGGEDSKQGQHFSIQRPRRTNLPKPEKK